MTGGWTGLVRTRYGERKSEPLMRSEIKHDGYSSEDLVDLSCLYEITRHLASAVNMKNCLEEIVEILAVEKGMESGTVTIINPFTHQLEIEVAHGISDEARRKGRYKLGEGITGRVVATGNPIIVPQIDEEPDFLNKTGTRGDELKGKSSFICVPIHVGEQVIGALSVDRSYYGSFGEQSEADVRFLTIVSGLIARTVHRIQKVSREQELLRQENKKLRRELSSKNRIEEIVGNSSRMEEVFAMVHKVADSEATVLLRGESGTGKTMVARALHYNSERKSEPFIVVNCSALPETLLESELFGHEKGAFTGAQARKSGRFELAGSGTLFLDEIGEMSLSMQVKLLGVIQERTFQRLGGVEALTSRARLVAATNRNLEEAVEDKIFREDLYYRLNVFPIYLPPLRERRTDILLLAEHFLEKYNKKNERSIYRISTSAIDLLIQYHWPGNVRELENCMERAVLICEESSIKNYHLPPTLQAPGSADTLKFLSLTDAVENFERELIIEALKQNNGHQTKAAKYLNTTLRIINYKIHRYSIDPKQFKVDQ